ncbi:hypothetical protein P7C73_g6020, partial [Tremellales sp. Uapishka_1]
MRIFTKTGSTREGVTIQGERRMHRAVGELPSHTIPPIADTFQQKKNFIDLSAEKPTGSPPSSVEECHASPPSSSIEKPKASPALKAAKAKPKSRTFGSGSGGAYSSNPASDPALTYGGANGILWMGAGAGAIGGDCLGSSAGAGWAESAGASCGGGPSGDGGASAGSSCGGGSSGGGSCGGC